MIRILFLILILISCQSSDKKREPNKPPPKASLIDPPDDFVEPKVTTLTNLGESFEAYFNKAGDKIIYISRNRPDHIHSQVYEFNIPAAKERRLTFHDGEDTCPFYMPSGDRFVYASTTDEIKENTELLRLATEKILPKTQTNQPTLSEHYQGTSVSFPPFDIYLSRVDGTQIERLTRNTGFDSEGSVHPSGRYLIFSSIRSDDIELYSMDLRGQGSKRLTKMPGPDGGAFFSPDGKQILWRHYDPSMAFSEIFIAQSDGKNPKPLTTKQAYHWSPSWHPSGELVIFSSNRDEPNNFEIYVADVKGLCLKRLTYHGSDDLHPSFSPDGKNIVFTSNRIGAQQLYLMEFIPPKACSKDLP